MCICVRPTDAEKLSVLFDELTVLPLLQTDEELSVMRSQMVIQTCYLQRHFFGSPPTHNSCQCEVTTSNHYIRLYSVRNMTQYKFSSLNIHAVTLAELFDFLSGILQLGAFNLTLVNVQNRGIRIRNHPETQSVCSINGINLNDDIEFYVE